MRFDVRFVQYVKSVRRQGIPLGHIRIVAGSHGIDVVLLHQPDVLRSSFARHHLAEVRIELVAVHAFDHQLLPIEEDLISLDLRLPEADTPRESFRVTVPFESFSVSSSL